MATDAVGETSAPVDPKIYRGSIAPRLAQLTAFELVAKDWLFSNRQPFAYLPEFAVGVILLAPLFLRPRPQKVLIWAGIAALFVVLLSPLGGFESLPILATFACAAWTNGNGPLVDRRTWVCAGLAIMIGVGLASTVGWGVSLGVAVAILVAQTKRPAVCLAGLAVAVCTWGLALWPGTLTLRTDDWLGSGLGAEPPQLPLGPAMAADLGLIANFGLGICLFASVLAAALKLRSKSYSSDESVALAGSAGALTALMWNGLHSASFLDAGSIGGTVVFAFSLAALNSALGAKGSRPAIDPKNRLRRRRIWSLAGVFAFLVLLAGWGMAADAVERLLSLPRTGQIPIAKISPQFLDATVAMEDGHFFEHHGFDLAAIHRALRIDFREGRVAQGGSTISQQLAKNLFLTEDRTVWRKVQEVFFTIELERRLSKTEILERYVNIVDYGLGCHGIGAAAPKYFHHDPDRLTLAESTALVGLVPLPPKDQLDWSWTEQSRQTALDRVAFFFPGRYSEHDLEFARGLSLDHVIYPLKDAWDRHAMETTPSTWHGVDFYFDLAPKDPSGLGGMYPLLKQRLADFLDEATHRFGLVGVDNIGVFNDRTQRGSDTVISAHAFGQAIDLSGFRLKDGSHLRVEHHRDPKVASKLVEIEAVLRKHFDIVVDWKRDPLRHDNHFHAEVSGPRSFPWRAP